jgi:two-component system phosphate regulon sensor histidine kinase PhoR
MKKQIFGSIFFTSMLSTLVMACLIFIVMYGQFYNTVKQSVKKEAAVIEAGYKLSGEAFFNELSGEIYRVTLIGADGRVLFDNMHDPALMENHADRPEVMAALEYGTGEANRNSETIGRQTFYYALRLPDDSVLRVASTTDSVLSSVWACLPFPILGVIVIAFLSAYVAGRRTGSIIYPINSLNLDEPLQNDVYEELSPLLTRIEKQHREIKAQLIELQKRQDEFSAITGSMSEGLILLGGSGAVLSMNNSAARLYGIEGKPISGLDFLEIDRSLDLQEIIRAACRGNRADKTMEISGRQHQFVASPVISSGQISGIVLLIFDITERVMAERRRREFTANVSHELKTPLQSIMGSAELMKNGLVKQEDILRFTERIYNESHHLVEMIDDIIRLSQLDELKGELPKEEIDLTALAGDVAEHLSDLAGEREVSIQVRGGAVNIMSVRRLVWEIVYNLCDNAIKYNRSGGKIDVTVANDSGGASLIIADTGIGIPKEDQGRVFERFYRVDKSHSRESGGTGLGLSIVKHAAQYLGAALELKSTEGKGTTVTVRFK